MNHLSATHRSTEQLPESNATAAMACMVLIGLAWLGVAATVVEFAASLGAAWAVNHGGKVIFGPLFGGLSVCAWAAVVFRIRSRRLLAALWWSAFSALPTLLTLQIVGVL